MTVLDFGKACVFSPVTGVVSLDGAALPNVLVKRRAQWQSERADTAVTDEP